jgi:hypothetical protein
LKKADAQGSDPAFSMCTAANGSKEPKSAQCCGVFERLLFRQRSKIRHYIVLIFD